MSQNTTEVKGLSQIQVFKALLKQNVYNIVYLLNHAAHEYDVSKLFYTHTGQLHDFQLKCLSDMNTQNNKEKFCRYLSKTRQKNNCNCRVMSKKIKI